MKSNIGLATARAITDGETVLATVEIQAPPRRVFEALNTKEVEQWWGSPDTYSMRRWRADLRAGGEWHVDVCLPDGTCFPASGGFLDIRSPNFVSLTRRYEWDHPALGRTETKVTYRFDTIDTPMGSRTRVTVRHDGFNVPEAAHEHAHGWERVLTWLQSYLNDSPT